MALLAASDRAVPPPDRHTLRRFRRIVSDLGADLYLGVEEEALAGLVHVTYSRRLAAGQRAQLDQLLVAPGCRRRGIGSALLSFARQRAAKRGCDELSCVLGSKDGEAAAFLQAVGFGAEKVQLSLGLPRAEESSKV